MPDKPKHESDEELDSNQENQPVDLLSHPSYKELMQKLNEADEKANQYWERILRMQAENENADRRTQRDIANAHKYALEKFVADLLPVIDSLELCINSVPKGAHDEPIIEGVKLTLKMFYGVLEKYGVKQIDPVDQQFDPEVHQAISMQYDPKAKPGSVLSILQKGYSLNDRLIRPALVVVAKSEE